MYNVLCIYKLKWVKHVLKVSLVQLKTLAELLRINYGELLRER